MDQLRARAFLDLLLGKDSRPRQDASGGADSTGPGSGGSGPAGPGTPPPSAGPAHGAAGFAGRVTLTVPLATVTGLADRPGDLTGIGPVDPKLEANTSNRYQTETCANQHGGSGINVPDRSLDPVFAHGISLREPAGPADVDFEEVE